MLWNNGSSGATRKQNNRIDCRFNGKVKDLSSRLYAVIEIAFCSAVFSLDPFSGRISKHLATALEESLSPKTVIPSYLLNCRHKT